MARVRLARFEVPRFVRPGAWVGCVVVGNVVEGLGRGALMEMGLMYVDGPAEFIEFRYFGRVGEGSGVIARRAEVSWVFYGVDRVFGTVPGSRVEVLQLRFPKSGVYIVGAYVGVHDVERSVTEFHDYRVARIYVGARPSRLVLCGALAMGLAATGVAMGSCIGRQDLFIVGVVGVVAACSYLAYRAVRMYVGG